MFFRSSLTAAETLNPNWFVIQHKLKQFQSAEKGIQLYLYNNLLLKWSSYRLICNYKIEVEIQNARDDARAAGLKKSIIVIIFSRVKLKRFGSPSGYE